MFIRSMGLHSITNENHAYTLELHLNGQYLLEILEIL